MAESSCQRTRLFSGQQKREVGEGVQRSSGKCLECEKEDEAVVMPCSPRCVYCPQCVVDYVVTQVSRSCESTVSCKHCRTEWLPRVVREYGGASQEEMEEISSLLTKNLSLHDGMVTCPVCRTPYQLQRDVRVLRVRCGRCYKNKERNCYFCWECKKPWTSSRSPRHCGNAGCLGSATVKPLVVLKEINRGSYGVIYDAKKGETGVVAKAVHAVEHIEDFKKEALLMKSLSHPNIVHCYGQEELKGQLYLVMEKIDGGTLYEAVKLKKRLVASRVGHQIAGALEYLHGRDPLIIHRDMSSQNILVCSNSVIKLADFGISRHMPSVLEYVLSKNSGTMPYMPPEVLGKEGKFTPKVDIFSLGVILLEVEILEPPNDDYIGIGSISEVVRRKAHLDKISAQNPIKEVITKCLANDHLARPSARDVRILLARL